MFTKALPWRVWLLLGLTVFCLTLTQLHLGSRSISSMTSAAGVYKSENGQNLRTLRDLPTQKDGITTALPVNLTSKSTPKEFTPASIETHKMKSKSGREISAYVVPEYYLILALSLFDGRIKGGYEGYTVDELHQRDEELMQTLQYNLDNPLVQEIHILYIDNNVIRLIDERKLKNEQKIVAVKLSDKLYLADMLIYANNNLMDKAVIILNNDIMLGGGFRRINTLRVRDERVMYTLTRHTVIRPEMGCHDKNLCGERPYQGSHDTHLFRLKVPLNETIIRQRLSFPIHMKGAELALMWTFRYLFRYSVRNPCLALYTFHNHCSRMESSIVGVPWEGWTKANAVDAETPFEFKLNYGIF